MWANILLIMKDVFAPRPFWVLLRCHERPLQKVRAKSIMRIWKTAAWMGEPVVRRLFVQLLTSEFGSLLCYKAWSAHVGGERWRSQRSPQDVLAPALWQPLCSLTQYALAWAVTDVKREGIKGELVALHWRESSFTFVVRVSDKNEAGIYKSKRSWLKEWCMRWL